MGLSTGCGLVNRLDCAPILRKDYSYSQNYGHLQYVKYVLVIKSQDSRHTIVEYADLYTLCV